MPCVLCGVIRPAYTALNYAQGSAIIMSSSRTTGVKRRVNPMLGVQIPRERTRGDCRYRTRNRRSARDNTTCDGWVALTRATLMCGSG
jgi:hypothetical protein